MSVNIENFSGPGSISISVVENDKVSMAIYENGVKSVFMGVAEKGVVSELISVDHTRDLLIRAVNNRTRERNYFRKYCELLQGSITDEDFDNEIESNEDEYVVSENETADLNDINTAIELSPKIKDVKDVDDMATLFSFSRSSIINSLQYNG